MFTRFLHSQSAFFCLTRKIVVVFCISLGMLGCSTTASKHSTVSKHPSSGKIEFGGPGKPTLQQTTLSKHYAAWKSAPYKLGGLSKAGIDCSGFVQVTYRDVFNKKLPRSTELLAKTGKTISRQSLKFGDLVFFKTGRSQRHVGIYINNGKFIHASSSRGVMQSSLNSKYWAQHYWKARRIF